MSKWWHVQISALLAASGLFSPSLQGMIAAHPIMTVVLASIWAMVGSILPSPMSML